MGKEEAAVNLVYGLKADVVTVRRSVWKIMRKFCYKLLVQLLRKSRHLRTTNEATASLSLITRSDKRCTMTIHILVHACACFKCSKLLDEIGSYARTIYWLGNHEKKLSEMIERNSSAPLISRWHDIPIFGKDVILVRSRIAKMSISIRRLVSAECCLLSTTLITQNMNRDIILLFLPNAWWS